MNLFISTATDKVYLALFENNNIYNDEINKRCQLFNSF